MFDALNLLFYQIITFDLTLLSSTKRNAAALIKTTQQQFKSAIMNLK